MCYFLLPMVIKRQTMQDFWAESSCKDRILCFWKTSPAHWHCFNKKTHCAFEGIVGGWFRILQGDFFLILEILHHRARTATWRWRYNCNLTFPETDEKEVHCEFEVSQGYMRPCIHKTHMHTHLLYTHIHIITYIYTYIYKMCVYAI